MNSLDLAIDGRAHTFSEAWQQALKCTDPAAQNVSEHRARLGFGVAEGPDLACCRLHDGHTAPPCPDRGNNLRGGSCFLVTVNHFCACCSVQPRGTKPS